MKKKLSINQAKETIISLNKIIDNLEGCEDLEDIADDISREFDLCPICGLDLVIDKQVGMPVCPKGCI